MDAANHLSIAQAVLAIVHRLLGGSLAMVGRVVGADLVLLAVSDRGGLGVTEGMTLPIADTISGHVDRTRATVILSENPRVTGGFETRLGLRAGVAVPLMLRDGTFVGTLSAYDVAPHAWAANDLELVADLAWLVAAEIEEATRLDRAVELERVKLAGLLARGLAHDFGNVVSSAMANLRSLSRMVGERPDAREPLDEIMASLEAGRELVARLREVGRSDAQRTKRRGIDPMAVASKVVALARGLFAGTTESGSPGEFHMRAPSAPLGVDLRLVPPDDPLEIRGDEHALEQALLNLVLNARDAVGERGGRVTVRLIAERLQRPDHEHPWHVPGEWAVLAVDDDGPGIDARTRAKLFEPGYTTKGEHGTGLGLFLVQTTATSHGGGVIVGQSPEGGARFAICLPARSRVSQMMRAVNINVARKDLVLVADDERGLRRACARELSAAGLAVAEAGSRAAALEIVEADPKRVVAAIIDRDLGDGSGEDVARRIRALNPRALIIETSGASDLLAESGAPVLEKPFDLQRLVERVVLAVRAMK
jgi:signal transduction histidine kinase/CheY-like chemotaxis protein